MPECMVTIMPLKSLSSRRSFTLSALASGFMDSTSKCGICANIAFSDFGKYRAYCEMAYPPKNTSSSSMNAFRTVRNKRTSLGSSLRAASSISCAVGLLWWLNFWWLSLWWAPLGVWNGSLIWSGVQPSACSGWCLFNKASRLLTFSQRDTSPSGRDSSKYMAMRNKFGGAYRMPSTLIASV